MLVLTRQASAGDKSTIQIGDNILVEVLSISGGQVRIGIQAPRELPVHRKELYDELYAEIKQEIYEESESQRLPSLSSPP